MIMKNILIITSHLPYPLTSGGNQAQFYIDDYLRKHFRLYLLYNENRVNNKTFAEKLQEKWPDVKLIAYNWKKQSDRKIVIWNKLIKRISSKISKSVVNTSNVLPDEEITSGFIDYVLNAINQYKIDLVQVEFNQFLPIVSIIPNNIKKVFIQHEIQYVRFKLQNKESTGGKNDFISFVGEMQRDMEIALMNRYDAVITLTETDRQKLLADGVKTKVEASPACVTDKTRDITFIPSSTNVVFVGGSGHYPNYDGLKWFLDEVWNLVLNKLPNAKLQIVGRWKDDIKRKFVREDSSIVFLGYVDDIASVMNNSVMIVPIRIGSGMRMKIVEAANIGCPFVSTTVGVEGLDFEPQKDFLLADNSNEFAEQLVRLLGSPKMQEAFSRNIKEVFEKKYSISILGKKRENILNDTISIVE